MFGSCLPLLSWKLIMELDYNLKFKRKFNTRFIFTEKYRKKSVDLLWSLITLEIILFFIFWGYNHEKCRSSTWNFRKLREKLFGFISYETNFLYFLAVNSEIIAEVIMKLICMRRSISLKISEQIVDRFFVLLLLHVHVPLKYM